MKRDSRNPYFRDTEEEGFKQDAWGAMFVLATGHAFEFLVWYAVAPIRVQTKKPPTINHIKKARFFRTGTFDNRGNRIYRVRGGPGTLPKTRMKRLELQLIGHLPIVANRVPKYMTEEATNYAASDGCLSNQLCVQLCLNQGTPVADWLK